VKQLIVLAIALACVATPLMASGDAERASDGPVSLTVWMGSWWEGEAAAKVVAAFEKEHPNRKLKIEVFPINNYQEKMVTSILGGSAADIIALDAVMVADVAGRNLIETWDDHIKGLDVEDFDKGIWSASVVNGKLYAIPERGATGIYFYNKTMFDEVGLAYPKEGWTYQDMLAMAKKITVPGQKYGVGIAASASDVANVYTSFAPVIWANKGEFLSADNKKARINEPEGVAGITYWTELYTKHKVVPEGSINFSITKDVVPLFMNNKVAMFPGSSAQFTMLAANAAVKWAPEVGPEGWNRGGGWAYVMPVTTKNKAAAREYVFWFVEPRNQSALMIRQPARISATTAPPWNAPEYKPIFRAGKWARLLPNTPAWGEMSNVIINELQKIMQGSKTPKQGADDMARQMNDAAAKLK
jgi:multiple sugar transport system substrate-binding protein